MDSTVPARTCLLIGPNASLTGMQAVWVLLGLSVLSLGIAGFFAMQGFWPVLPWAGVEMLALGAALWVSIRRNAYREVLRFDGDRLHVEFGMLGRGARSGCDLPRGSTRALLEPGDTAMDAPRLLLSSGPRRIEIGHCLTEEEKRALHGRLRQLLRPGWGVAPAEEAGARPAET